MHCESQLFLGSPSGAVRCPLFAATRSLITDPSRYSFGLAPSMLRAMRGHPGAAHEPQESHLAIVPVRCTSEQSGRSVRECVGSQISSLCWCHCRYALLRMLSFDPWPCLDRRSGREENPSARALR